jgi:hypothetical protein
MQNGGTGRPVLLLITFLALALVAGAAPVGTTCGAGPTNSGAIPGGNALTGTGCDFGDKTFSGLSALPSGVNVQLTQQANRYTVTFFGNLTNSFNLAYDVAVNSGPLLITRVSAGIDLVGPLSNASLTKTVTAGGKDYVLTVDNTTPGGTMAVDIMPAATSLHVADAYTGSTPGAVSFSNTFGQSSVPEPATIAMIGFGLLGLGLFGRRKLSR